MAGKPDRGIVLMSIQPQYVDLIFLRQKRVEFRKVRFRRNVSHILIYASRPVMRIVGVAEIRHMEEGNPEDLWRRYSTVGGISREDFLSYYSSTSYGVAIGIGEVHRFAVPLRLSDLDGNLRAPQSYIYLDHRTSQDVLRRALRSSHSASDRQPLRQKNILDSPAFEAETA